MSKPFNINRRQLLGMAGGYVVTAAGSGIWTPKAMAQPTKRRRHLINIQSINSGVDTAWSLSTLLDKDTAGVAAELKTSTFLGQALNKARFPDSEAIDMGNDTYFGPVMGVYSQENLNSLAVWRGLQPIDGHISGNRRNQTGHFSPYAAAFSVILADALATGQDYLRPLHYVQVSTNPDGFASQVGFYDGAAVPINIADSGIWGTLASNNATDVIAKNAGIRAHFEDFIKLMSQTTQNFKLESSRNRFSNTFLTNFLGTQTMLTNNYPNSKAFQDIWARYQAGVAKHFTEVFLSSPSMKEAMFYFNDFEANKNNATLFLNNNINLKNATFPFALAEFLVTQDLAAVVDIPSLSHDGHADNSRDLLYGFFTQSCISQLMTALRQTPLDDDSGKSLLDQTLIVNTTEFDRWLARGEIGSTKDIAHIGTDHGNTMTVQMAGYGARPGIFGARMGGPQSATGGVGNFTLANPTPINPDTGRPSADGVIYNNQSVLPTILNIFEVSVPLQQTTEDKAFPAIKKT